MIRKIKIAFFIIASLAGNDTFCQTAHSESFDGTTFMPNGWIMNGTYGSSTYFTRVTSSTSESASPHTGAAFCKVKCAGGIPNGGSGNIFTPKIDYTNRGASTPTISVWVYRDVNATYNTATYDLEGVTVYSNTTTSSTFSGGTALGFIPRRGGLAASGAYLTTATNLTIGVAGWYQYSFNIPAAFTACAYIGFKCYSKAGRNIYIDDIDYTSYPALPGCATLSSPANGATAQCPYNPVTTLNWTAATCEVSGYKLYFGTDAGATNIFNGTDIGIVTTYSPALSVNTTYYWKIIPTNGAGDATGCAAPRSFTTSGPCYCSANASWNCDPCLDGGGVDYYEYIYGVQFGSISNYTGLTGGGYALYTSPTPTISTAASTNLQIQSSNNVQQNYFEAWIDWNQDGDFADASENVMTATSSWGSYNVTVSVPGTALAGATRMRVMMWDADEGIGPSLGCGDMHYSEVEDYPVYVCMASITTQPSNASMCTGGSASFGIVGANTSSYQWQRWTGATWVSVANGTPTGSTYTNANTATMTVSGVSVTGTTTYRCAATGACTVNSNSKTLTVNAVPACNTLTSPANAATAQCRNITLSWGSTAGASGYKLFFGTDASATNIINGVNQGVTYSYATVLAATTTYYWKVVPWTSCGDATGCSIRSFTTGANLCYCVANATWNCTPCLDAGGNDYYEYISNVQFGSINNSTGLAASGYANYTTPTPTISISPSTNLLIQSSSNVQYNHFQAWIDWNQDGDFADANENVMPETATWGSYNVNVAVPSGATPGATKMRVMMWDDDEGWWPSLGCGDMRYGEVEDYPVFACLTEVTTQASNATMCTGGSAGFTIVAANASTYQWQRWTGATWVNVANGTPAAAVYTNDNTASMTVSGVTATGTTTYRCAVTGACTVYSNSKTLTVNAAPACNSLTSPANAATGQCRNITLSWGSASGSSGYKLFFGTDAAATNIINGVNQGLVYSYSSLLTASTTYYWKVVPWNACGDASGCSIRSFTTGSYPCYCTAKSTWGGGQDGDTPPVDYDYINQVTVGTINRSSWFDSYINTGIATNAIIGTNYTLNVYTPGAQGNYFSAYADWNQDGDFQDAGETLMSGYSGTWNVSVVFSPPAGAQPGNTTLRIMEWDDNDGWAPSPAGCGEVGYGDVEDYYLTVCSTQFTAQPSASYTTCATIGSQTISTTTTGAASHQWQYSANGSTGWSNLSNNTPAGATYTGATTATITVSGITTGATTYYYRCNAIGSCTATSTNAALTVRTISTDPTSITAPTYTVCPGYSSTLTVSGGSLGYNASWKWYTGSCGGTLAGTGSTLAITPGATTTYYVRAEGTCNNSNCASVTITVGGTASSAATGTTASSSAICNGISTTLTATGGTLGAGAVWTWYSGSCGGTLVGTGSPITVSPGATTTYYVRAEGCNVTTCPSGRVITVTNIPACNTLSLPSNGSTGQCRNPTLTWNSISGATGYKVYVGTDAAATNVINGTNVGNILSYTVPTLAASTLHYWKIVPTNSCGDPTGCTIRNFTTGANVCYCTAQASSGGGQDGDTPPVDYDYINSVSIGTINRSSGFDWYINTGLSTNAVIGTSYSLYIYTPGNQWNYVSAYADWNQDGDFLDANETILNSASGSWNFSATVIPPAGAAYGNTTLRIMQWDDPDGYAPSPAGCGDVSIGDVEDYTLIVCNTAITTQPSNASYCTGGTANFSVVATGATSYQWERNNSGTWVSVANGTPTGATYSGGTTATMTVSGVSVAGTTSYRCAVIGPCTVYSSTRSLTVSAIPSCNTLTAPANGATNQCKNVTLTWNSTSSVSGYKLFLGTDAGATNIINGVNQGYAYSYTSVLSASTTYYWKIVPWNSCGDASGCTIRSFTTGTDLCYCTPTAGTGYNYIEGVSIGTINNWNYSSSNYIDYSTQTTTVLIGTPYTLTVSSQGDTVNNYCRAFVDWNQDGDFIDAGEMVLDGWGDYYYSSSIVPPAGAVGGPTRLRIMLTDDYWGSNSSDGCSNTWAGEIEDYRLNVCPVNITVQPGDNAACVNSGSGVLTITAAGASSYQWQYKNGASWNNVVNGTPAGSVYTNATTSAMTVAGISSVGTYQYRTNVIGACTITSSACTLTVISGVPNPSAYTFPGNGAINQCANSYTSLNWNAATGSPASYKLYLGTDAAATNIVNGTNIGNVLTYNPLPLANNTTYYWKIVPVNNCGSASGCPIWSFSTGASCYCVPNYSSNGCSLNMYISNFSTTGGAANISNASGCNSAAMSYYADYSAQNVTVISGNGFNFSVTQPSTVYNMGFRIWIDYNNDFDFADAGEDVWNSGTTGKTFSGSIVVPSGTSPGTKRMRVRNKYNALPSTTDYCSTLSYGETEDYSLIVVAPCVAPTGQASGITFSAVTCNQMTVGWTNGNGSKRILVAKASGAVAGTPANSTTYTANSVFGTGGFITTGEYVVYNGTSNSVTVTGLTPGVTYYFAVFEYNCTPGWEEFLLTSPPTNNQATNPITTLAGADQYICSPNTTATMAGTGSGTWSLISGPNTPNILNASSPTTQIGTVTGLITGIYVFRWTATCGNIYDDVRIIRQ